MEVTGSIPALHTAFDPMPAQDANNLNELAAREIAAGNLTAALALATQALAVAPGNLACRETLARVHYHLGDLPAVIAIYESIVNEQPLNASALKRLTRLLIEHWQFERADEMAARARALDATDVQLLSMQVYIKHELGNAADAKSLAIAAAAMVPDNFSLALDAKLLLPMVYADSSSLVECRKEFAEGLAALHAGMPTWLRHADQVFTVERSNFLLAYQGGDDRNFQQRYATLIGTLLKAAAPELVAPLPQRFDGTRKLKIGFVGKWFYSSTAGNYFERWITQLDATKF